MNLPILLCHGVCRFDVLWNRLPVPAFARQFKDRFHYFRGVGHALEQAGFPVVRASVGWARGVEERGRQLGDEIRRALAETGADRLHLIAHSMGGLDARRLLFSDRDTGRIHERVASLTTIGTPHRGSPVADAIAERLEGVGDLERFLPSGTRALLDLRTADCRAFDDDPRVRAFEDALAETAHLRAYAGVLRDPSRSLLPGMAFRICEAAEGPSDGMVPLTSANWRDEFFAGTWENTDHVNQIGRQSLRQSRKEPSADFLARIHANYLDIARAL